MQVSLSDFKADPEKYVAMADQQDIYITKNGKQVVRLTQRRDDRFFPMKKLDFRAGSILSCPKNRPCQIDGCLATKRRVARNRP